MPRHVFVIILSFVFGMLCGAAAYGYYAHQPTTSTQSVAIAEVKSSQLAEIDTSMLSEKAHGDIIDNEVMLADQVMANTERWRSHETELRSLRERLSFLEATIKSNEVTASSIEDRDEQIVESGSEMMNETALIAAGVRDDVAADIVRRHSAMEMRRLELRDRAVRENWIGTDRYAQALSELNEDDVTLRDDIGDDAYDRLLYSSGQSNRIVITSVIQDSPAAQAGIVSGDVVLRYAGERVFSWSDLSSATTQGQRGEYVSVLVERSQETVELSLPRGPLGVKLDSARRNPEEDSFGS